MSNKLYENSILGLAEATRDAMLANPDFVYAWPEIYMSCDDTCDDDCECSVSTDCAYFDSEGNPSCAVGHGLSRLPVEPGVIARVREDWNVLTSSFELCIALWPLTRERTIAERAALRWLEVAQGKQDARAEWGTAVMYADKAKAEFLQQVKDNAVAG